MAKQLFWISGDKADLQNYSLIADDSVNLQGARALDVGQGNAVAVLTEDDEVAFYFDAGAGCFWNSHTAPADVDLAGKFTFDKNTHIVLSHWDADHWYAAGVKLLESAKKSRWLAPRQEVSPMHQNLAAQLKSRLKLWPKNRTRSLVIETGDGFIQIDKCTGDTRNYSGLAVILVRTHPTDDDQIMILPGDAGFQHIPGLTDGDTDQVYGEVVGLMTTHHGSRTHLEEVPEASEWGGTIVYSYGEGNGYGHPAPEAVEAYEEAGWEGSDITDLRTAEEEDVDMEFLEDA
jgi:beta-lactamase superfamily II metal-dependent hydrolase